MTVSVLIGLALQVLAVWIVHVAIRGRWLGHIGAILLAVAVVGHGAVEVLQAVFPDSNRYRRFVTQAAIDDWVLLVSAAILVYALAFAATVRRCDRPVRGAGFVDGVRLRWLVACAVPLAVATFQGRGALQPVAPGQVARADGYALAGLAGQYLVLLVAVIGVVVVVRHGSRWMVPVIAGEIVVVSAVGARFAIVAVCALTAFGAALCGVRPPRRQVAVMVVLAALCVVTISAARDVAGRAPWLADSGGGARMTALVSGAGHLANGDAGDAVVDDAVYRVDFNTFGALVLDGLARGRPGVGAATIRNNLLLGVPSALNPDKLSTSVETRNEEAYLCARFGLNPRVDWLPGFFGTVVAYWGAAGLLLIAMVLGLAMAAAQRVVSGAAAPWRLVLAMGLVQCALLYEAGPAVYITQLRGAVALAALALVLRVAAKARRPLATKAA